jgi:hypothetical protein
MQLFQSVALLILGGILVLLAIGGIVYGVLAYLRVRDVRRHGKHIVATVTKIDMEYVRLTRRGFVTSFFVHAEWEDPETHKVYHFKSDAGGAYLPLNHPPGSTIDVLIDPRNPRRYEVQLKSKDHDYVL